MNKNIIILKSLGLISLSIWAAYELFQKPKTKTVFYNNDIEDEENLHWTKHTKFVDNKKQFLNANEIIENLFIQFRGSENFNDIINSLILFLEINKIENGFYTFFDKNSLYIKRAKNDKKIIIRFYENKRVDIYFNNEVIYTNPLIKLSNDMKDMFN